ncbi:MAG: hypothetical protein RL641_197 [Candidatus Parcubacteria bacterium]|jgi:hypothetical protein
MSEEERKMLERSLELAEENNKILHSMQRSMRLARVMSILYWVFIIGSAVGAYYLIQPYVEGITGAYGGAQSSIGDSVSGLLDTLKDVTQ